MERLGVERIPKMQVLKLCAREGSSAIAKPMPKDGGRRPAPDGKNLFRRLHRNYSFDLHFKRPHDLAHEDEFIELNERFNNRIIVG